MKNLPVCLITIVTILASRPAGQAFTFTLPGGGAYSLVGSQTMQAGCVQHTLNTYFAAPVPGGGDEIQFWDTATCQFSPSSPLYFPGSGWSPNPSFPVGSGCFYIVAGANETFNIPTVVCPLVPQSVVPDQYVVRSSQTPVFASYGDLMGTPGAFAPAGKRTFIWRWDAALFDLNPVYRSLGGNVLWRDITGATYPALAPLVPVPEAAFVGTFFPGGPAPTMTTLVVVPPPCPPFVTLELTFAYGSGLGLSPDPIWVADLAKYTIYIGGTTTVAGNIVSATPEFVPFGFGDCALKRVQSVLLTVKLNTQPGCTYDLKAKVASLKGTVGTATLPFSLPSLANDTPSGAIALTAGVPACGSLLCGGPTLLSTILLKYPTGSGENAKDVFFKYDAPYSGIVTVTASPSTCPGSCPTPTDVFLAVYRGSPTALEPNPSGTGDPWWNHSGSASSVTFKAQACATYYIRVSAPNTGLLPGDFKLLLSTSALVQHDLCSGAGTAGAQSVSANSSTPFDNVGAATTPGLDPTVLIVNDKWFSFLAPPGGGPVTVDTCEATWNTAVAVFGNCASILTAGAHIAYNAGGCSGSPGLGSSVTFPTVAGHTYFVCVGGQTGSASPMGCGFLHVSGGIPAPGTLPTTGGACNIKTYAIYGLPNNVGWSWSLTAPASCSPNGLNIGGTVSGISSGNALNIAHDFALSINAAFPGSAFCPTATEIGSALPSIAYLQISTPCSAGAVALHVGPYCTPANCWATSATCWVNVFPSGLWVGPLGPCSFNPDIYELADENNPDADCNANGQADYADIVTGISADVDGNGVPDECQACVPVVVLDGPASTSAGLGGPASFQVQTAGSVPMTYQWRKDGLPLTGQTNAVLQLANATAADAGGYDVVISNTCAQVTSPQALLVVGPEPWLQMTLAANNVVLSWSVSEYHLQTNLALDDPTTWTDVPGDSPVTIPITDLARYFRLVAAP